MLALRLIWRNWRSGEVKILASALVLAVATVTAIAVFASRMDQSLERQSNVILAADRVITSRLPIPDAWLNQPDLFRLEQARIVRFPSMVFADDEMHLASIKAVSNNYPLRGELETSDKAFAVGSDIEITNAAPAPGEAWVDSRLLPLMDLQLGDQLAVGDKTFKVSKVLIREPDQTIGFSVLGPRVLINIADLAATQAIQPGSRIDYRWLLAGQETDLQQMEQWLTPKLGEHYRLITARDAQQNIRSALDRGSDFLLLAGMIGVLLASVAIAIASQQFARRHVDQVALIKSLGASAWRVRQLYFMQLFLLAVFASTAGLLIGEALQRLIAFSLASLFDVELVSASYWSYGTGIFTGLVCLLLFALPPLWHLPGVSPLKVLRREMETPGVHIWVRGLLGVSAVILLIWVYSGSLLLTSAVVVGLAVVIVLAGLGAHLLLRSSRQLGLKAGSVWRLAFSNLERQKGQSITQIIVFGCAIMLLMVLFAVRSNLIDEWRMQIPTDAPNHFVLNIAPHENLSVQNFFRDQQLEPNPFYPMTLGRLKAVNGEGFSEAMRNQNDGLQRELNLSWAEHLADDNKILEGVWWPDWQSQTGLPGVSVSSEMVDDLNIKLGDVLSFSLGGLELEAEVASIRSLDWNSMRPNFFFLFSPGTLNDFSPSYMTSVYIPTGKKTLINQLLKAYPTIVIIEVDRIIERVRTIISQISQVIELILWLVLIGGMLVLSAAVHSSMNTRMQEAGLLRALGSGRKLLLGSLCLEFSTLGLFSGLLAVVGGEMLLIALQLTVFEQSPSPHFDLWLTVPVLSIILIGGLGLLACQKVVSVPPGLVLRELEG